MHYGDDAVETRIVSGITAGAPRDRVQAVVPPRGSGISEPGRQSA